MKRFLYFSLLLNSCLTSPFAEASYFRFWRGYARSDLSAQQFVEGLNSGLLPATAALARTSAQLQAYYPVLLNLSPNETLPNEVALVEYASQASYNDFRSTPAGKAYADLHWDFFDRERSKSSVPGPFFGTVELGRSYELHPPRLEANTEPSSFQRFQLWVKPQHLDASTYLERAAHLLNQIEQHTRNHALIHVDPEFILVFGEGLSIPEWGLPLWDLVVEKGSVLSSGKALNYPTTSLSHYFTVSVNPGK